MTGDHGIRTREEDPDLPPGKIDECTFHVQFLLFAPGMTQASPVWNPELARRTTFFWSGEFHGAMGFHRSGRYAMWNRFYDDVFVNSSLSFESLNALPPDAPGYDETVDLIETMESINRQWTAAVLRMDD